MRKSPMLVMTVVSTICATPAAASSFPAPDDVVVVALSVQGHLDTDGWTFGLGGEVSALRPLGHDAAMDAWGADLGAHYLFGKNVLRAYLEGQAMGELAGAGLGPDSGARA